MWGEAVCVGPSLSSAYTLEACGAWGQLHSHPTGSALRLARPPLQAAAMLAQRTDEFSDKAASNVLWALATLHAR